MKDQSDELKVTLFESATILKKKAENLRFIFKTNPWSSADFNHIEYAIDNPEDVYNFVMEARELINLILENKDATNI